jgi:hypothetical protein
MRAARACLSTIALPLFGLGAFERVFPPPSGKINDWVPTPHTGGRNAVAHSERSAELCGWAVVDNEKQGGNMTSNEKVKRFL